jgi:hypothetical protein
MTKTKTQRCRQCGCTQDQACRLAHGHACYWVLPDLCSNPRCLFSDPRTPPLELFGSALGPQPQSGAAGWIQYLLFRPLGVSEMIPRTVYGKRGRAAVPEPREDIRPLVSSRVPVCWLLRCAFFDPQAWAVEIHPWIHVGTAIERAMAQIGGLGLVRRNERAFVVRRGEWEERKAIERKSRRAEVLP